MVERVAGLSEDEFVERFLIPNRPCVITGDADVVRNWRVFHAWGPFQDAGAARPGTPAPHSVQAQCAHASGTSATGGSRGDPCGARKAPGATPGPGSGGGGGGGPGTDTTAVGRFIERYHDVPVRSFGEPTTVGAFFGAA